MKFVPTAISQKVARQMLQGRKASPSLLFGVGVAGMVGSTILACRATLKLEGVVEQAQMDLQANRALFENRPDEVSEREYKQTVGHIYTRSAAKIGKLYGPSLILGAASIGCLTKSHNILSERNAALTAAYVALDQGFTEYRERVIAKYGEDEDQQFRYSVEEVEVIGDDGKLTLEQRVSPDAGGSIYARFFDEYSTSWNKEPEYNVAFLKCQQNWFNDKLRVRGHVFLNEVYDALGIERTTAGSVVGWVVSHDGDNYIDFGIFGNNNEQIRNFVNGREGSILLDFNVDGIIYDKIDHRTERATWQS
jgi:hypothetical protein